MGVSERTFGVEIECTYGAPPTGKSDVYQRLNWGDRDPMRARAIKEIAANKDLSRWAKNIGIDGSGIEIRSPILKGQEGIEELSAMFDFLINNGSTVTNQDGMHVHHGAADFNKDWKRLYYACASWGHWTAVIHKMVARRRRNGSMCPDAFNRAETLARLKEVCLTEAGDYKSVKEKYDQQMKRYYAGSGAYPRLASPAGLGGRGALNLSNLTRAKGTIEIRLAEGMMDRDSAIAWVKFGQRFLDHSSGLDDIIADKPKSVETLLKAIQLDEDAADILKRKAKNNGKALVNPAPGKIANGVAFDNSEDE